jgi:glyoxylase-like metal-dependent hydrolase (beta-lactamase superfamily II)
MTTSRRVTDLASVQLAPNPGPMTLDGTNSYVLRAGAGPAVVVDPGPDDDGHVRALAGAPVELILITHQHLDHTAGSRRLHELTGAPVRAPRPEDCHGGDPLRGGERITVGDLEIQVVATPGHTADSVSFFLPGDGPRGSVLTGDTVLGRGSTVIGIPDGTLAQYLDSLRAISELRTAQGVSVVDGAAPADSPVGLPAHGPVLPDIAAVCRQYRAHRLRRLEQVRAVVASLGLTAVEAQSDDGIAAVLAAVYPDVDPDVQFAAAFSVATQLAYLAAE